jgi:multidrug efflux pump subunit AcrB
MASFFDRLFKRHAEAGQSSDELYLERLSFRQELRQTWLNFFVVNFRVVILLIIMLTGLGLYAFAGIPRELNPEVKIAMGYVTTVFPGASPSDVEELVTKKLETKIASLKGIKKISSSSMSSYSGITVEFDADQDIEDAVRKLTDKVREAKNDLPSEANDPLVKEISLSDRSIITFALSGSLDPYVLRRTGEDLADKLEQLPGVREVRVSGGEEREFEIAYDTAKLNHYGVSLDAANSAVKAANVAYPAGQFESERFTYPVRTDGRFWSAAALADLPVAHGDDGSVIYLKDLAVVRERAVKSTMLARVSMKGSVPRPAITIEILKRTGGSIVSVAEASRQLVKETVAATPGLTFDVTSDEAKRIAEQFDQLQHDFLMTIFMVAVVLFLIIGLKEAFVAGLAIPLVFFATFGVMLYQDLSLNFLSMFSLLLSLGLLVDDAIVVVSATKMYLRTGKFTPEEAVLLVLNDFKVVLTTTTLTTVWAFLPLLLATGIMGSYLRTVPITVSTTLVASLVVALVINHPLAAVLERLRLTRRTFWLTYAALLVSAVAALLTGQLAGYLIGALLAALLVVLVRWYFSSGRETLAKNAELMRREWEDDDLIKSKLKGSGHDDGTLMSRLMHGIVHLNNALPWYERWMRRILATRKSRALAVGGVAAALVVAVLLPVAGIVRSEFFPNSDDVTVYVNYRGPVGLKLAETDKVAREIEAKLRTYPEISTFQTLVGASRSASKMGGGSDTSERMSVVITLVPEEERVITSYAFADKLLADLHSVTRDGVLTVESTKSGPPSGAAFEAQITGDDLAGLAKVATGLKPLVASIPEVANVESSLRPAPAEYTFTLDPVLLERNSLNAAYVGSILRTAVSGVEVTKVMRGEKQVSVTARLDASTVPDLKAVQDLVILNLKKQPVALKDVAKIELKPAVETITRVGQRRTVTLSASLTAAGRSKEVLAEFQRRLAAQGGLPEGYAISYGGENEQNTESVMSILRAMVVAFILIVATLVIQFNSFRQAAIVMAAIPLSLIGVFFGLAISRITLSFPSLIGVLALFGIVVKNSIILVDKINLNLKSGIPFEDAVVDAGKSRFEAIFITSFCTILGILPITLSNAMWQGLGSAVIFGLSVSSFLTLFIVPALYAMLVKHDE